MFSRASVKEDCINHILQLVRSFETSHPLEATDFHLSYSEAIKSAGFLQFPDMGGRDDKLL